MKRSSARRQPPRQEARLAGRPPASAPPPSRPLRRLALAFVPLLALALAVGGLALVRGTLRGPARPAAAATPGPTATAVAVAASERLTRDELTVDFSIGPIGGAPGPATLREGELAEVRLTLAEPGGAPLIAPQRPAVWIDREQDATRLGGAGRASPALSCEDKVRLYVQGTVGYRPDVDLNSYYVLALNEDGTISVIDPLLSVAGMTQLLAMPVLKSPGEDWALTADQKRLFVSLPRTGQIAVLDTVAFRVLAHVELGGTPTRLALSPDERQLWVADESETSGGVAVVDTQELRVVGRVRTAAGQHDLLLLGEADAATAERPEHAEHDHASAADGVGVAMAFVTNRQTGTLSAIDGKSLRRLKDVAVGRAPVALAHSTVGGAVYVADEAEGALVAVDAASLSVVARLATAPGLRSVRFAPGGRWGFAVGERSGLAYVVDAAERRVVHSLAVGAEPDQVAFTSGYAYVRARGSAEVAVIDLAQLGKSEPPPVVRVIAGQTAPGTSRLRAAADAIAPAHEHPWSGSSRGGGHVLIANPADRYIYYYMEGMNAPMGGFQNYGRAPRAVRTVDRGLRQMGPGAYAARFAVPGPGRHQVAFLLDSPRAVHCFSFTAEPAGAGGAAAAGQPTHETGDALQAEFLAPRREVRPGEPLPLRFRLTDPRRGEPVGSLEGVDVVLSLASGQWRERFRAAPVGDGTYAATLRAPQPGVYYVALAGPLARASLAQTPTLTLTAKE